MERRLFRTHSSDLSDDELRLLDVMFDAGVPIYCLRRERFVATFMQPCHDLDDDALQRAVNQLRERGILKSARNCHGKYVYLTNHGGSVWSEERCPDWERYATDRYGETKSGKQFATVVSPSPNTCNDFVGLGGLGWPMADARVRTFEIQRHALIAWHPFPRLFVAVAMNIDSHPIDPDWKQKMLAVEQRRTWWRSVRELQKFLTPIEGREQSV